MLDRVPDKMQNKMPDGLKIRRALISVSDKTGVAELAKNLEASGAEIVATGKTREVIEAAGVKVINIESITGNPEAFQGRMKTLSFNVFSGILYRRNNSQDEKDRQALGVVPIDCVVVNFYPFEKAAARADIERAQLIEEIDIGGPGLVRAAAKNAPDVLVLTDPSQYPKVTEELKVSGTVSKQTSLACAARTWEKVRDYDNAIADRFGEGVMLRYGENPHQSARVHEDPDSPVAWSEGITKAQLSYNNILDASSGYGLMVDLLREFKNHSCVVILKHNNPCGVAVIEGTTGAHQLKAFEAAWAGDPVSAFGGVVLLSHSLKPELEPLLTERFVEVVAAPDLTAEDPVLARLSLKKKKLKAVRIRRYETLLKDVRVSIAGGMLVQSPDVESADLNSDSLKSVTRVALEKDRASLARFGIAVCKSLKSNAVVLVRETSDKKGFELVGAGQGQPNRVEALERLCIPRAKGRIEGAMFVSDAFFPFRDTVDAAAKAGIRMIVQPGGSIKDADSIAACDEHQIAMAFTGVRHFRH